MGTAKETRYPGVDVTVEVSAHNPCNRCHKRLECLLSLVTANFGPIAVCFRCLEALRDDGWIEKKEYQQIFVKK